MRTLNRSTLKPLHWSRDCARWPPPFSARSIFEQSPPISYFVFGGPMPHPIQLGNVIAIPGTVQYGQWEALSHPTGHAEFLPVIIAQGKENGPCIWLTAGIHGPEHTGPSVLYRLS